MKEASEGCLMGAFKIGSLKQLMGLAHRIEERNAVLERTMEKAQEEFLNKHFRVMTSTKFTGPKGNWSRVTGHTEPVRTYTLELKRNSNSVR